MRDKSLVQETIDVSAIAGNDLHVSDDVTIKTTILFKNANKLDFAFKYYRHLTRLHAFVEQNIDAPFQLTDVAAEIGISTSRLSHLFIEKTGITFSKWIRHKRIEKAANLLSTQDRKVADVAYSVGFETVRTFERSFKKVTGLTPSEFRKIAINSHSSADGHYSFAIFVNAPA